MNMYLIAVLCFLLLSWLLSCAASYLNARAMRPEPPEEFADAIDAATYAKARNYARATMRHTLISSTTDTALVLIFLLAGGFNWLDTLIRAAGFGPTPTGLLYIGALALGSWLASLPFEVYHTFVLENRFGFNTTTLRTFAADRIKGVILTAFLGGALLAAILFFFQYTGQWAWVWCWGFATAFSLALTYVAPTWILPLFNKFSPLENEELRRTITDYAAKTGFQLSGIFVMDGSKRTTKANAFFTGFGSKRRIALFDTLVNSHGPEEILAVLAHEVGHAKLGHIRKRLVASILKTGLIFFLMSLVMNSPALFRAFGMEHMSIHAGLVFFFLLYTPAAMLLSVAENALSRRHEYQADAFARQTTGRPEALVRALKSLSVSGLSNLTPHWLAIWLEYSHPPVLDRVRALRTSGENART
ncbi:M48 family metallopeptidase [Pseudodesulfovibrio tunisiensis]|uniref:M48 family metallopeptidase n=1 Tax=Pseudodesulfovibrio tunisiensis TaxID=463192 RepID=UPI001FB421AA|nr:M48 family metallopeptidase [Pseudodesulfovibrio tunisiensis]